MQLSYRIPHTFDPSLSTLDLWVTQTTCLSLVRHYHCVYIHIRMWTGFVGCHKYQSIQGEWSVEFYSQNCLESMFACLYNDSEESQCKHTHTFTEYVFIQMSPHVFRYQICEVHKQSIEIWPPPVAFCARGSQMRFVEGSDWPITALAVPALWPRQQTSQHFSLISSRQLKLTDLFEKCCVCQKKKLNLSRNVFALLRSDKISIVQPHYFINLLFFFFLICTQVHVEYSHHCVRATQWIWLA